MGLWYQDYPDLFRDEREGLEALGFELDAAEHEAGRVVFHGSVERKGSEVKLVIHYPDSFPYLRPEVFAPDLRLPRHQNPLRGNLCLLDRSTREWDVDGSGAWLIAKRVPALLDLVEGGDQEAMRRAEAPQGEPASRYFPAQSGTVVFVPEAMLYLPKDVRAGTIRLAVGRGEGPTVQLRACLTKVEADPAKRGKGTVEPTVLAVADEPLRNRFGRTALHGSWVRLATWPLGDGSDGSPDALWHAARATPGYREPQWQNVQGGKVQVLGILAAEEVQQGQFEDAWLFAVRLRRDNNEGSYLARGERLSRRDLAARIPSVEGLQDKVISLTGLGAIGAPMAMEFARSLAGELRMLDDDAVETGTTVRWPLGLVAVGHFKTAVLSQALPAQYPYTKVRSFNHRIGSVPAPGEPTAEPDSAIIDKLLDGADILVDATAELGVQHYLESEAYKRHLPQIYAWMTEGGVGGAVARVVPGQTGCWVCLQWHIEKGTIPAPPHVTTGRVQPRGCTAPTFTGTGFDALPVIAQAVRVTTHTLLRGRTGAGGPDVFVCAQLAPDEQTIAVPTWSEFELTKHAKCERCGGK